MINQGFAGHTTFGGSEGLEEAETCRRETPRGDGHTQEGPGGEGSGEELRKSGVILDRKWREGECSVKCTLWALALVDG